jgi:DNA-binding XRE family transcriptional regulator
MGKHKEQPYAALGARLKFLREQWQQSIDDVSGTLEIDAKTLHAYEEGKTLPSENVLEMFINHFLLTDDQAEDLKSLADLTQDHAGEGLVNGIEDMLMKQIVMYLPDHRVLYTDSMQATVNKNGVILQFMQSSNTPNQPQITVNRIGMSRDHAERMIQVLKTTLEQHDKSQGNKFLPPSSAQ